jgi:hypothetical protein
MQTIDMIHTPVRIGLSQFHNHGFESKPSALIVAVASLELKLQIDKPS